jgi:hypothetical protein
VDRWGSAEDVKPIVDSNGANGASYLQSPLSDPLSGFLESEWTEQPNPVSGFLESEWTEQSESEDGRTA